MFSLNRPSFPFIATAFAVAASHLPSASPLFYCYLFSAKLLFRSGYSKFYGNNCAKTRCDGFRDEKGAVGVGFPRSPRLPGNHQAGWLAGWQAGREATKEANSTHSSPNSSSSSRTTTTTRGRTALAPNRIERAPMAEQRWTLSISPSPESL